MNLCIDLCRSSPADDRSKLIDRQLLREKKVFSHTIRILLLGAGEAGKSTILKQMKLIHTDTGFSHEERYTHAFEVRCNMHDSIREIVKQMELLEIDFEDVGNIEKAKYIMDLGEDLKMDYVNATYIRNVKDLWKDRGVRACYNRSNEYQLIDSAKYFIEKVATIMADNYIPSNEDLLKFRIETVSIKEMPFTVKRNRKLHNFVMIDVGGQRQYRQKWTQLFEGVNTVLFIISCAEFDLTLRENSAINRMKESINLFNHLVWRNRYLQNSGIIVFLNKQDILEEKVKRGVKIENYIPEYINFQIEDNELEPKLSKEFQRARLFIKNELMKITERPVKYATLGIKPKSHRRNNRNCYFHFTIATNTKNISIVFCACQDMILSENLKNHYAI